MVFIFSIVLEAKTQRSKALNILKEKYFQPTISYPSKPPVKDLSVFRSLKMEGLTKFTHYACFLGNYRKMHSTEKRE